MGNNGNRIIVIVLSIVVFLVCGYFFLLLFVVPFDSGQNELYYMSNGRVKLDDLLVISVTCVPMIISVIVFITNVFKMLFSSPYDNR